MDWKSINFDWNRARSFLVTAEEGSLSAAARALNSNQPTLSRQIHALEQELGIVLFERTRKGLELTPNGLELLDYVKKMASAANDFSLAATGQVQSLEGSICISATEAMAAFDLPPVIKKLRQIAPGIEIELIASNTTSDLKKREADIAIRAFRPTQSDLIVKKLKTIPARLYATRDYLESVGSPTTPQECSSCDFLGFDQSLRLVEALNALGFNLTLKNFPIVTENHLVHWQLVKHSVAIGVMPENVGDKDPEVVRVFDDTEPFPIDIWLVAHRELRTNKRVKMVFDFLAEELG